MNYSTLNEAMEQVKLPEEIDALSVYRALEQVQDGRHKRGVRSSVALIFTLILLGESGRDDDALGDCGVGTLAARSG
jgi:hypothetical protein